MPILTSLARAKINLTLHVGRVNSLGYHPLHSLVVFADIGDILSAKISDKFSLEINGPFAEALSQGNDNLVLKAAKSTALANKVQIKLAYILTKNLPVSSGIGGGSADAAAAVRLLGKFNGDGKNSLGTQLIEIGADVPVCFKSKTSILEGIGEE
ncbi:MAG: 4-(cytidine 5'-diphospho)-2-C-methyl-D-erythritol kinase, partial [Robiginitomaculum sp.]|nr:4-(cytidine 5'-diphospho)-2-C-methyl-D-erythritol kinase [Robiginitomaculum sp.]